MISFWNTGLKRAKSIFLLFVGLYITAILEIIFYGYFTTIEKYKDSLLTYSYGAGVAGLLAGMAMVHFIIVKNYTYEMGNLETLGYTRLSYILFYVTQFLLVFLFSVPVAILFLFIIYLSSGMQNLGFAVYASLSVKSVLTVFLVMIISIVAAFIYFSRREPILLLKEKA